MITIGPAPAGAAPPRARCDSLDNDCDGAIDEDVGATFFADVDSDGFGSSAADAVRVTACHRPAGFAPNDRDCDDGDPRASPVLPEVCDGEGRDDDCDGVANPPERCACSGDETRACPLPGLCAAGRERCVAGAFSECTVRARQEVCDGADDEDCDGEVDEGLTIACWPDADVDGFPAAGTGSFASCPDPSRADGCPVGRTARAPAEGAEDCDDLRATVRPTAPERAGNGIDDDCDGEIDEASP